MNRILAAISVGMVLGSSAPALAQQDFVRHDQVTLCLPGKVPGSYLAKRTDDKLFYSAKDKKSWRPATAAEHPYTGMEWQLGLPNFLYTVTPAGALMDLTEKGLYRSERIGQPAKLVSPSPPRLVNYGSSLPVSLGGKADSLQELPWTKANGATMYYKFANEQFGYAYFDYAPWIYTSDDGGVNWQLAGSLTQAAGGAGLIAEVNNIHFLDAKTGFGVVHLYKPAAEYLQRNDGDITHFSAEQADPEDFYGTRLLRTTNGGRTWSRVNVSGTFSRRLYHTHTIRFYQASGKPISFYAYGENQIYESVDEGASFAARPIKDFAVHWNRKVTAQEQCYVDNVHFAPFRVWFFNLGKAGVQSREAGY